MKDKLPQLCKEKLMKKLCNTFDANLGQLLVVAGRPPEWQLRNALLQRRLLRPLGLEAVEALTQH